MKTVCDLTPIETISAIVYMLSWATIILLLLIFLTIVLSSIYVSISNYIRYRKKITEDLKKKDVEEVEVRTKIKY